MRNCRETAAQLEMGSGRFSAKGPVPCRLPRPQGLQQQVPRMQVPLVVTATCLRIFCSLISFCLSRLGLVTVMSRTFCPLLGTSLTKNTRSSSSWMTNLHRRTGEVTSVRCRPCESSLGPAASCSLPTSMGNQPFPKHGSPEPTVGLQLPSPASPRPALKHTPTPPTQESKAPHKTKLSTHPNLRGNNRARGGVFSARGSASLFCPFLAV